MATDHVLLLGTLVGNFQSLECLLRFYLQALAAKTGAAAPGKPYCDLTVGEVVSIDEVSNYDTLGKLVQKYNADVVQRDPALKVDDSVVRTRDLLAPWPCIGRVSVPRRDAYPQVRQASKGRHARSGCCERNDE